MIKLKPYDEDTTLFIKFAFDYLNGKVNSFNEAELIIDWALRYDKSQIAYHVLPNKIYIFPMVMARYCTSEVYFHFQIVDTLVHELTHTDQVIEFKRMNEDKYMRATEYAVILRSEHWLKKNLNILKRDLGFYTDEYVDKYINDAISLARNNITTAYVIRTYADHLWMLIDPAGDIAWDSDLSRNLIHIAIHNHDSIYLGINGNTILIQDSKNYRAPVQYINQIFSDIYDGSKMVCSACITKTQDNALHIEFDCKTIKVMCTTADKNSR